MQILLNSALYILVMMFSLVSGWKVLDVGFSMFTASALVMCFMVSAYSLFKMICKDSH